MAYDSKTIIRLALLIIGGNATAVLPFIVRMYPGASPGQSQQQLL
jgi:hypothetical protein